MPFFIVSVCFSLLFSKVEKLYRNFFDGLFFYLGQVTKKKESIWGQKLEEGDINSSSLDIDEYSIPSVGEIESSAFVFHSFVPSSPIKESNWWFSLPIINFNHINLLVYMIFKNNYCEGIYVFTDSTGFFKEKNLMWLWKKTAEGSFIGHTLPDKSGSYSLTNINYNETTITELKGYGELNQYMDWELSNVLKERIFFNPFSFSKSYFNKTFVYSNGNQTLVLETPINFSKQPLGDPYSVNPKVILDVSENGSLSGFTFFNAHYPHSEFWSWNANTGLVWTKEVIPLDFSIVSQIQANIFSVLRKNKSYVLDSYPEQIQTQANCQLFTSEKPEENLISSFSPGRIVYKTTEMSEDKGLIKNYTYDISSYHLNVEPSNIDLLKISPLSEVIQAPHTPPFLSLMRGLGLEKVFSYLEKGDFLSSLSSLLYAVLSVELDDNSE